MSLEINFIYNFPIAPNPLSPCLLVNFVIASMVLCSSSSYQQDKLNIISF